MPHPALTDLETARSSDFKKSGWRGVFERLLRARWGALAVTNHQRHEAVLLTIAEYQRLVQLAAAKERADQAVLETLRREFDDRLASLNEPDAAERIRRAMDEPLDLRGTIRIGDSY